MAEARVLTAAERVDMLLDENERLRIQVLLAETAAEEATIRAEQAEREARRPGGMYGLGYLVGVAVGALIVGVVGGAEVVNALLGGRPW